MKRLLLLAALFASGCDKSNAVNAEYLAIVNITPSHGAVGVSYTTDVTATFSASLDEATVTGTSVCLTTDSVPPPDPAAPCTGGAPVEAAVSYEPASRTVRLVPADPLLPDERYTLQLTRDLDGKAGRLPAIVRSSFRTIPTN